MEYKRDDFKSEKIRVNRETSAQVEKINFTIRVKYFTGKYFNMLKYLMWYVSEATDTVRMAIK